MKRFTTTVLFAGLFFIYGYAQNSVGIGTTTPNNNALLHVDLGSNIGKGILVTGSYGGASGTVPDLGSGSRLMFFPGKAAFRAGLVNATAWNNSNVGIASVGIGESTIASGEKSTAIGYLATASGNGSTAMGVSTKATGGIATAMGNNSTASGDIATAMGNYTTASGDYATVMGASSIAGGNYSFAMGYLVQATGNNSFAAGTKVSTNSQTGAFFFGDSDPNNKGVRPIGFPNQIAMRFNGGYYFISSDAGGADLGVQIPAGGNSWSARGLESVVGAAEVVHNRPILPNAGSGSFMIKV